MSGDHMDEERDDAAPRPALRRSGRPPAPRAGLAATAALRASAVPARRGGGGHHHRGGGHGHSHRGRARSNGVLHLFLR